MDNATLQQRSARLWVLAARQRGVVARRQLLDLGFTVKAIRCRIETGRLHRTRWRGVYAVGRPELTRYGVWRAALLSCGPEAALSHECAADVWGIRRGSRSVIDISVPAHVVRSRPGVAVHRRASLEAVERDGIRVTSIVATLIDIAARLPRGEVEEAVNEADKRDLVDPEALRIALDEIDPRPGVGPLRALLDRHTFRLTDSRLEQDFLPLVRAAGLPLPVTRERVNDFRVDFYWPDLGLVVEADGLRYHRTPAQQASDRRRDQAHTAAGLTPLRFTHGQVRFEPDHVRTVLAAVGRRLASRGAGG